MDPVKARSAEDDVEPDDDEARAKEEAALREELELSVAEADAGDTEDFAKALAELRAKL